MPYYVTNKYPNIFGCLIKEIFEKGSLMLPLKILYWIFFYAEIIFNLLFFIIKRKISKYKNRVLNKYSNIFIFLRMY